MHTEKTLSNRNRLAFVAGGLVLTAAVIAGSVVAAEGETQSKTSQSNVVTNDNGSVSRTYVESTVTTNGNMVTERRRETRTTLDTEGNMLATTTSEYAQSYSIGNFTAGCGACRNSGKSLAAGPQAEAESTAAEEPVATDSFLGLKFGEEFASTNFVHDADEPTLLRAEFAPSKPLAGFDDYYVYVTPTSHRVVKVYACARHEVEPGARYRRHYLIEALEKRYHTWARLCSYMRPYYAFNLGNGRYVTACLAGATRDYETVLTAWDEGVFAESVAESNAIREAARKAALEKRESKVNAAADAF